MSDDRTKLPDEIFCSSCGAIIKRAAELCPKCGVRNRAGGPAFSADASDKDWLTALLLCIFVGCLGVHRFYLGRTASGVCMILFGWLTLGIWWLIDVIMVACGNFKDAEGKPVMRRF